MKLYIIGNGFDINLGLKTKYEDFYYYLEKRNRYIPKYIGKVLFAERITDPLWSDFENGLSNVNFLPFSMELDELNKPFSIDELFENHLNGILGWKDALDNYFRRWINESYNKHDFYRAGVFTDDCIFINFNYTNTLEDYFYVEHDKILYIHGNVLDDQNPLIYGHGSDFDMNKLFEDADAIKDGYIECTPSELNDYLAIDQLMSILKKPVATVINRLDNWMSNHGPITEIFILGHSIGDVDYPYFELIRNKTSADIVWNFSYYSLSDINHMNEIAHRLNIPEYRLGKINEFVLRNDISVI